jgi:hypothetical protein
MEKDRKSTPALIRELKESDQDFEWYPTTNEIIGMMIGHAKRIATRGASFLDIGAGNGKVLEAVRKADLAFQRYAIEKSAILLGQLDSNVFVVGTDFHDQSLFDKAVTFVFCNPPYREFEAWAERIILESACEHLYLVLPSRWKDSVRIQDAIRSRNFKIHKRYQRRGEQDDDPDAVRVIGSFDFENAEDRKARAYVDLIYFPITRAAVSGFRAIFNAEFSELIENFQEVKPDEEVHAKRERKCGELIQGGDFIANLVTLYNAEMSRIRAAFLAIRELDPMVFFGLEISVETVCEHLRNKLINLKKAYWKMVFENLDRITRRLTSKSRRQLMEVLFANTAIDFTAANAYAVALWVIKRANMSVDGQFLEVYEMMIEKANVRNYTSNQRLFKADGWRYKADSHPENSHFGLDYRIVCQWIGGIKTSQFSWEAKGGLENRAHDFLADFIIIARNLGFDCVDHPAHHQWFSNKKIDFWCQSPEGKAEIMVSVRAFQNGNMHLKINQRLMLAMNVEYGRLKGWIHTAAEAASEFSDLDAAQFFGSNFQLSLEHSPFALPNHQPENQ